VISSPDRSALVLGGGVAGIAAAVRLAEDGWSVTILETSRKLGGRATSHTDPTSGRVTDNCQHVVLGCCTNLLDLYERLSVRDKIEWHDQLHFFDKAGHHDVLEANWFPAPLHLSRAMKRFTCLTKDEKSAIERAMLAMLRMGRAGRERCGQMSFAQWLADQKQPAGAISKYWEVVNVSALNQTVDKSSALYAIQVFQEGFCAHRDAYRMGVSSVPLGELYDTAESVIVRGGGSVRYGASVKQIHGRDEGVESVELSDGEQLKADVYVSALPFDRLDRVVSDELRAADSRLASLGQMAHSPILGVHVWYAESVLSLPHMIFVDSPVQWVFDKGQTDEGQHLHVVISAAFEQMGQSSEAIVEMVVAELEAYLPKLQGVEPVRTRVIKEKRATFSCEPGIDAFRPSTGGAIRNLLLAGDWVDTGWPATMEGAARSGYMAAAKAGGHPATDGLVADLKASWLCWVLGLR
jgi:squalene-associated FAD-dependent desaturase